NLDGVTVQGFTINGFDGASTAIETAAVYVIGGPLNDFNLLDNVILANGDAALLSNFNVAITNSAIRGNTFGGQTFAGTQPGGSGNTYGRPLVTFAQGSPPGNN